MITTQRVMNNNIWGIVLFLLTLEGCHHSYTHVKDMTDFIYSYVYVNIRCCQIDSKDTIEICYPYEDIKYLLVEDSRTQHLLNKIDDYVSGGEVLPLPEGHSLLEQAVSPESSIDSIYALGGYKRLLRGYFFCHNELNKESSCCLDRLHSACENSVYFGHRTTPCYYKTGDEIMDKNKEHYIIYLLYKNNIYCMLDSNGNICLLNCNLKKEDFIHIPFPIVEIR